MIFYYILWPDYFFIMNLTLKNLRVTWEEGTSTKGLPQSDWPVAIIVRDCLE